MNRAPHGIVGEWIRARACDMPLAMHDESIPPHAKYATRAAAGSLQSQKIIPMMMFPRGCVCALMISVLLSGCGSGGGGNQGSGFRDFSAQ
ncbi:hypothetical protein [Variovorax gossypii]